MRIQKKGEHLVGSGTVSSVLNQQAVAFAQAQFGAVAIALNLGVSVTNNIVL